MAGDENFTDYTTALDIINKGSIILEMGAQLPENPLAKELTILPYQSIDVVQRHTHRQRMTIRIY